MAKVTDYHVLFYGSEDGYQGNRAQIALYDGAIVLGYIRFHDPGMPFPADNQSGALITMHLPSAMFENVIDVLRNEKSLNYYFAASRAVLDTASEPVGEGESEPGTEAGGGKIHIGSGTAIKGGHGTGDKP